MPYGILLAIALLSAALQTAPLNAQKIAAETAQSSSEGHYFENLKWVTEEASVMLEHSDGRLPHFTINGKGRVATTLNDFAEKDVVFYHLHLGPNVQVALPDSTIVGLEGAVFGFRKIDDGLELPRAEILLKDFNGESDKWIRGGYVIKLKENNTCTVQVSLRVDRRAGTWDLCTRDNVIRAGIGLSSHAEEGGVQIWPGVAKSTELLDLFASAENFLLPEDANENAIPDSFEIANGYALGQDRDKPKDGENYTLLDLYMARNARDPR